MNVRVKLGGLVWKSMQGPTRGGPAASTSENFESGSLQRGLFSHIRRKGKVFWNEKKTSNSLRTKGGEVPVSRKDRSG